MSSIDPPRDLTQECIINLDWQWGANFPSCYKSLKLASVGDYGSALPILQSGQADNEHVRTLYSVAQTDLTPLTFWTIVATAALIPSSPDNMTKAKRLLQSQFTGSLQSLQNTKQAYEAGNVLMAAAEVQDAVWNPNYFADVNKTYRACIRDTPGDFFREVEALLSR